MRALDQLKAAPVLRWGATAKRPCHWLTSVKVGGMRWSVEHALNPDRLPWAGRQACDRPGCQEIESMVMLGYQVGPAPTHVQGASLVGSAWSALRCVTSLSSQWMRIRQADPPRMADSAGSELPGDGAAVVALCAASSPMQMASLTSPEG